MEGKMSKEEFFKKYKEIILKTNGGNDDYVVAICQISNLINEFANEQEKQLIDLQSQLAEKEELKQQLAEKEKEIEYQESMKILAVKNQNQKAIEQLEKVKEILIQNADEIDEEYKEDYFMISLSNVKNIIDNQIKQLKEGK